MTQKHRSTQGKHTHSHTQTEAEASQQKCPEWWWAGMWESSLRPIALKLLNVLAKAERALHLACGQPVSLISSLGPGSNEPLFQRGASVMCPFPAPAVTSCAAWGKPLPLNASWSLPHWAHSTFGCYGELQEEPGRSPLTKGPAP